jgi:hypothetical protein
VPTAGDTFTILTASGGLGGTTFTTELLPALGGGLYLDVVYNPNDVTLVAAGVLGDYNRDGVVEAADYTVWRDTLGSTTDMRANGDNSGASAGVIDQADYALWKAHFGDTAGSGSAGASPSQVGVPEPASLPLFLIGGVLLRGRLRSARRLAQKSQRSPQFGTRS